MSDILYSLSVFWIPPWKSALAGILWCFWLGAVIAVIYAWWHRNTTGKAVLALREAKADSPENAKTVGELGLRGFAARALQSKDKLIRKEKEGYYLPPEEEKKADALIKAGPRRWWQIPLAALLCYALLVAAWYIIPLFNQ